MPELKIQDLECKDRSNRIATYYAHKNGHQYLCDILYENFKNAIPNALEKKLRFAINMFQSVHILSALSHNETLSAELVNKLLGLACELGNLDLVRYFISLGADIDAEIPYDTPLTCAVSGGNYDVVDELLNARADVNKKGHFFTPMGASLYWQNHPNVRIIDRLLLANPNLESDTCIHTAVSSDDCDLVKKLFKAGANLNILSDYHLPPIYYAIKDRQNEEMVNLLLDLGAEVAFIQPIWFQHTKLARSALPKRVAIAQLTQYMKWMQEEANIDDYLQENAAAEVLLDVIEGRSQSETLSVHMDIIKSDKVLNDIFEGSLMLNVIQKFEVQELIELSGPS